MWRFDVPALDVADLGDERRLASVGLSPPSPGRRAWSPYQQIGETLWRHGWQGLLAPSAARPAGRVLCLFVDDPDVLPAAAVPPPTVDSDPPAPPTGLRT